MIYGKQKGMKLFIRGMKSRKESSYCAQNQTLEVFKTSSVWFLLLAMLCNNVV